MTGIGLLNIISPALLASHVPILDIFRPMKVIWTTAHANSPLRTLQIMSQNILGLTLINNQKSLGEGQTYII